MCQIKKMISIFISLIIILTIVSNHAHAESNEVTIYNYLTNSMGLNSAAACGVLANIYYESSFNPNALGDSGTSYGICQWHNSRWDRLKSYCNSNGYDWTTLIGQLHYLDYELRNYYSFVYNYLKNVSDSEQGAYDAGYYWCYNFEVPANTANVSVTRGNTAKNTYWPRYGNIQQHDTHFVCWYSEKGEGYQWNESTPHTNTGKVGNWYYFWFAIVDSNTEQLYSTYSSNTDYQVTISGKYSDGTSAYDSYTYYSSDANWVGFTAEKAGDVTFTAELSGSLVCEVSDVMTITKDSYTLTYNANGGTGGPSAQTGDTTYRISTSKPTRTGYTLLGWATSKNASQPDYYPSTPLTSLSNKITINRDTTLYAVWSPAANIGTGNTTVTPLYGAQTVWYKYIPSVSGNYTITGIAPKYSSSSLMWKNTIEIFSSDGTKITSAASTEENVSTNITYHFVKGSTYYITTATIGSTTSPTTSYSINLSLSQADSYTLTYNANGGTGAPSSQKGTVITISNTKPTKTGYKFLGWRTDDSSAIVEYTPGSSITLNEDTILYAVWSRKSSAPFWGDLNNDGYVDYKDSEILLDIRSDKITPTVEQQCFADVNMDGKANGPDALQILAFRNGKQDNFTAESNAVFEFVPPTKTEYKKGESLNTDGMKIVVSNNNNSSVRYELVQNITITGFNSSNIGTQTLTATYRGKTFTFIVTVKSDSYTVTYNANRGSVSPSSATVTAGNSTTLPTPTKSYKITYNANGGSGAPSDQIVNLTCKGWSTSSTATSASYSCGSNYTPTGNITLYAIWTSPVSPTLSNTIPTRNGYTFLGWATNSSATSATYSSGGSISLDGNKTLYAVWSQNPTSYTLTYNANGGSGAPANQTGALSYTISSSLPTKSIPYVFLGWSKSSSATSATYKPGDSITLTQNTTLYAVWKSGASNTLTLNKSEMSAINFAGQEQCYKFVPAESGTFIFESTGSLDSRVKIYDVSGNQIGYDDDSGEGNNFKLTADLNGGTTYYVKVYAYSSYTGSTTFTVTKEQTIIKGDLNGDGLVDAGDAVLISRYDAGLITLTAEQLKAGDLNNDGLVDAGDAVIISRFDAGLITNI